MTAILRLSLKQPKEDKYYILRSCRPWQVLYKHEATGQEYLLRPVTLHETTFKDWKAAPEMANLVRKMEWNVREEMLGRRINDEVELFDVGGEGEGGTAAGLWADLEAEGLKVRLFVPEPEKTRFPTSKLPSAALDKPMLRKCADSLDETLRNRELEDGQAIEYGLIANPFRGDRPGRREGRVLIVIVSEEVCAQQLANERLLPILTNGVEYEVVGCIYRGQAQFKCEDSKARSLFVESGKGELKTMVQVDNHKRRAELEGLQVLKAERRRLKKARQRSGADVPAIEDGSVKDEDTEARKQARKEAEKAKKKLKKERHRVEAKLAETAAKALGLGIALGDKVSDEEDDLRSETEHGSSEEIAGLDEEEEGEEGGSIRVVHATSMEDIRREVGNSDFLVMYPDEEAGQ